MAKRSKEEEPEEIEVNLEAPEPLNKKQKRLLKKGKIDENKLKIGAKPKREGPATGGDKKSEFGVWIGNLSFDTSRDDIIRFLESRDVAKDTILRVHMPTKANKNQGFSYVDFETEDIMKECIKLSESHLNGRNLLIKNAKSFDGRPAAKDSQNHKPSRILFVGNLSFDTTTDQVESHFQHCGPITRVRMATFEDSGNCKGFAFIDFQSIEAAAAALADKECKRLNGRNLRMEYGEDRTNKRPQGAGRSPRDTFSEPYESASKSAAPTADETAAPPRETREKPNSNDRKDRKDKKDRKDRKERPSGPTSGAALATAQRASTGIVESRGKKITF